ncbi:MAG TPA: hypothetical protein VJ820_13180 [Propionibacteriaceae bacterium]|nr:hypothetical protein [Propionibacteriaceae bacterium]
MAADLRRSLLPHIVHGKRPVSSAVYGTVSVVAIVAVSAHENQSAGRVLAFATVSMSVIWAVHVYASTLEHTGPHNLAWRGALALALREEFGVIEGALAPLLVLLLGAIGFIEDQRAIVLAMWSGVVLLMLMPFVWLRRSGASVGECVVASCVAGLLGLVLILFKILVH